MVNLESDGIPNLWYNLPLIYEARIITFKKHFNLQISHFYIAVLIVWIRHVEHASCLLFGCGSLSTPFGTFDENSTYFFKPVFQ